MRTQNSNHDDSKKYSANEISEMKERKNTKKGGSNPKAKSRSKKQSRSKRLDDTTPEGIERNNDPNWYFLDANLAETASQLSFQQLAGYPIDLALMPGYPNVSVGVPNVMCIYINPSPGVQTQLGYPTLTEQQSAINLAGFRLFSKLTAFTGRTATYGPQDISTMILIMGELISQVEFCRRVFGVAYQMNMRNRAYPRTILESMGLNPDDLLSHMADYRMAFNSEITRINQLPIPLNVAYFDKCASLYEKIYLDQPSSMAQTIITMPATTWDLDETTYSGGTVLRTADYSCNKTGYTILTNQFFSYYLNKLHTIVSDLMNSSTLQVVYTDLLNLAAKTGTQFWHFDYLLEGYMVVPEYNPNFSLQFHNSTMMGVPSVVIDDSYLNPNNDYVTPYNDVYPDANNNALIYNPSFPVYGANNSVGCAPATAVIIDMLTDAPSAVDRIEVTRFTSLCGYTPTVSDPTDPTSSVKGYGRAVLPDHYFIFMKPYMTNGENVVTIVSSLADTQFVGVASAWSKLDWAPTLYEVGLNSSNQNEFRSHTIGDLNFYTVIDAGYLRRLHDFVGLALYDMR